MNNMNKSISTLVVEEELPEHGRKTAVLREHLELTSAEASIVAHFLARPELTAVARMRGASYQTVRNQFKSAMQKTETHSQAELALKAERLLVSAAQSARY